MAFELFAPGDGEDKQFCLPGFSPPLAVRALWRNAQVSEVRGKTFPERPDKPIIPTTRYVPDKNATTERFGRRVAVSLAHVSFIDKAETLVEGREGTARRQDVSAPSEDHILAAACWRGRKARKGR